MKKILLSTILSGVLLTNLHAEIKKNAEDLLIEIFKQDVKVIKNQTLKEMNNMELLLVEDVKTKQRMPVFSNSEGTILMPFSPNIITKNPEKLNIEAFIKEINDHNKPIIEALQKTNEQKANSEQTEVKKEMDKELLKMLNKDSSNIKVLQSGKKETVTILLDPTCKYCIKKVEDKFNEFKDKNINVVFVGVLGKEAIARATVLEKEWDNSKTFNDKLLFMKKYFNISYKLTDVEKGLDNKKVLKLLEELSKVQLGEKYDNMKFIGNYGVPYIINQ